MGSGDGLPCFGLVPHLSCLGLRTSAAALERNPTAAGAVGDFDLDEVSLPAAEPGTRLGRRCRFLVKSPLCVCFGTRSSVLGRKVQSAEARFLWGPWLVLLMSSVCWTGGRVSEASIVQQLWDKLLWDQV